MQGARFSYHTEALSDEMDMSGYRCCGESPLEDSDVFLRYGGRVNWEEERKQDELKQREGSTMSSDFSSSWVSIRIYIKRFHGTARQLGSWIITECRTIGGERDDHGEGRMG